MSYNGSGTFNINTAGQPVVTGTVISSTAFNSLTADLGTGLSTAITKDGQTVATARIPFAAGINSSLVTDATNTTTGSIITAGGVGIAKALFVGTTANIAGTTTLAGVTATSITDSGLTSGRVTFASTSGLLADAAALAWDGTSLSATKFAGALNGTVGATTAAAGAFTTLSATGAYVNAAPAISGFPLATQYVSGQNLFVGTPNTAGGIRIIAANNALTSTVNLELQGTQVNLWGPTTLVASVSSTGLAVTGTLSASGQITASATGGGVTFASTGGQNIRVYGGSASHQWDIYGNGTNLRFTDNTGGGKVVIDTALDSGALAVTGLVDISAATSGQIQFPATQNASTNANTLDDYEEGDWTPNLGGTATYTGQSGQYTKVGRLVNIRCSITVDVLGTGSAFQISGLPFTANATGNPTAFASVGNFQSLAVSPVEISAFIGASTTTINMTGITAAAASTGTAFAVFGNSARIDLTVTYFV